MSVRSVSLVLLASVVGCAVADEGRGDESEPEVVDTRAEALTWGGNPYRQGPFLYGVDERVLVAKLGAETGATFEGPTPEPVLAVSVRTGSVVARTPRGERVGTDLAGLVLPAVNPFGEGSARLRILRSRPLRRDVFQYDVEVAGPAGVSSLCPAVVGADDGWAVALAGFWNARGDYTADASVVSFACASGALAKCVAWAHAPYLEAGDDVLARPSKRERHQACARAARADYCGDGRSWTAPGTVITLRTPPAAPELVDAAPRGMLWEAAWGSAGALCLGRKRWDALANGDLCGGRLKDPRLTRDEDTFFCEEAAIGRPGSSGSPSGPVGGGSGGGPYFPPGARHIVLEATLSNQSYVVDVPLRTWRGPAGAVVTTALWRLVATGDEGGPAAGYELLRDEGPIYHPDIIADAKPAGVVPLYLVTPLLGGVSMTTTQVTKLQPRTLLGYVFPDDAALARPSTAVALVRYRNTVTGARMTTTRRPLPKADWVLERVEGYLPRGPMVAPTLRLGDVTPLPRFPLPSLELDAPFAPLRQVGAAR